MIFANQTKHSLYHLLLKRGGSLDTILQTNGLGWHLHSTAFDTFCECSFEIDGSSWHWSKISLSQRHSLSWKNNWVPLIWFARRFAVIYRVVSPVCFLRPLANRYRCHILLIFLFVAILLTSWESFQSFLIQFTFFWLILSRSSTWLSVLNTLFLVSNSAWSRWLLFVKLYVLSFWIPKVVFDLQIQLISFINCHLRILHNCFVCRQQIIFI